jgi:hypothetical protein
MPRRAPPTALRLHSGPTPPRNTPKHTLPSLPQPIFHQRPSHTIIPTQRDIGYITLDAVDLDTFFIKRRGRSDSTLSDSSCGSPNGSDFGGEKKTIMRGPWDHSRSTRVYFDVETLVRPLEPVALWKC